MVTQPSRRRAARFEFLRGSWTTIIVWPIVYLLLAAGSALALRNHFADERLRAESTAQQRAMNLATDYARNLAQTLREIDRITQTLAYYWKTTNGALRLEDQIAAGLFAAKDRLHVTIVDRNGVPRTSTIALQQNPPSIAQRDYFEALRESRYRGLIISPPRPGLRLHTPVVLFSRRLETSAGAFDGVVVIAIDPAELLQLYDQADLHGLDFIAVTLSEGVLLAARDGVSGADAVTRQSVVERPQGDAVTHLPPRAFSAQEAGVLASRTITEYGVRGHVGLAEENYQARATRTADSEIALALVAEVVLGIFVLGGIAVSARLAWRKHKDDEIRASYALAIEGSLEGYYSVQAQYNGHGAIVDFLIRDCNERGAEFLHLRRTELIGQRFSDLYSGEHARTVLALFSNAMTVGFYEDDFMVSPHSPLKSAWMHRRLVRSGNGLAMTLRDISEYKSQQLALLKMANQDALTELANRHWMMQFLPDAIDRARARGEMLALLFIDLDAFKPINDRLGHGAGDELLQLAAVRLRSVIRPEDHAVRLGGDEFTVILQGFGDLGEVSAVAHRILKILGEPFTLVGGGVAVTASIGISLYPLHCEDAAGLLHAADIAMYAAKQSGTGQFKFYS